MIFSRIIPRLLLGFALLSPLPLGGLAWFYSEAYERSLNDSVLANLTSIANKKTDQINSYINERLSNGLLLAKSATTFEAVKSLSTLRAQGGIQSRGYLSQEQRYREYFRTLFDYMGYYDLLLTDAAGNVVFSILHEPDLGSNLNTGPYRDSALARAHRDALAVLDTQVTPAGTYAPSGDKPAIFIVIPIVEEGRVLGSVALQLDLDKLTAVTSDATGLGQSGETVLAQRVDGEALYVGPLRHIPDAAFHYRLPISKVASPMQAVLKGGHGQGITRDYVGVPVIAAWRHLPALNWGMVVKMDVAEAFAQAERLRYYMGWALGLLLLMAGGTAVFFGRSLVLPIRQLMNTTGRIAAGDLKQRAQSQGCDEFRQLAQSFNRMAERITEDQAQLEQRVDERTRELQHSKERYDELADRIPVGVYTFRIAADGTMAFEYVSPQFCRLLGVSVEAILADVSLAFSPVHPEDLDGFVCLNRKVARTLQPFRWEGRFAIRGETRWLRIESTPTPQENGDSLWNGVVSDITERKLVQQALQESESRFRSVFEKGNSGIAIADAQGNLLESNDSFVRMMGYGQDELRGRNFASFTHPDDLPAEMVYFSEIMAATRDDYRLEKRLISKPGGVVWVDLAITVIRDEKGNPVNFIGLMVDITSRKQSEMEYRTILNTTMDGFWINDVEGRFLDVNHAYCEMVGYSREELLNMRVSDVEVLEKPEETKAHIALILVNGSDRFESRHRCKDGRLIDVEISVNYLPVAGGGMIVFLRDITARKAAEVALREAKKAAEAANQAKSEFLANMSHEIRTPMNAILGLTQLVLDSELSPRQEDFLRKAHTSARALLGVLNDILDYSKIEAGRLEVEHVPMKVETILKGVADLFGAHIEEKGLELFIEISPEMPMEVSGDPLRLSQVLNNLVGNALKFTERGEIHIKADVAEHTSGLLKLRFAVRDTGIGLNRTQAERLFKPFTQADSSITRKYGGTGLGLAISQRLVSLMGGEIAVSGTEGKGASFTFTIQVGAQPELAPMAELQRLHGLRALVVDDQETSRQILKQLLDAWRISVDTCASGEAALARIQEAAQAGKPFDVVLLDWVMPGMSGLDLARRLEEDVAQGRLDHPLLVVMVTAHNRDQLLAQAASLQLNGVLTKPVIPSLLMDLLVNSLPRVRDARQTACDAAAPGGRPLRFGGGRVLLVEDNVLNQQVTSEFLKNRGVEVILANHGGEAVDLVRRQAFDAVLMDLHMPVMDGYDATLRIRELEGGRDLPIIAMTAAVMQEDRDRCAQVGMVDFIAKPTDPDELVRVLSKYLRTADLPAQEGKGHGTSEAKLLPDALPGFDLAQALRRLDGNRDLLRRLLQGFAEEQTGTSVRLDRLLESGEMAQAARLLHTLKGAAANLGAVALAGAARQLEDEIRAGGECHSLRIFADALEGAVAAIATHLPAADLVGEEKTDRQGLSDLLSRLVPYLRERELIPDELLQALSQFARVQHPGGALARLRDQVDRFDHDGALATIAQLAASLDLNLKI